MMQYLVYRQGDQKIKNKFAQILEKSSPTQSRSKKSLSNFHLKVQIIYMKPLLIP